MNVHVMKALGRVLALAAAAVLPVAACAQTAPTAKASSDQYASRWDIFLGYSYLAPHGTVQVPQPSGAIVPYSYDAINVGGIFSGAYYFNRYVGAQAEFSIHQWGDSVNGTNIGTHGNNDGFDIVTGGLIARLPSDNITPFVHALVNANRISGPDHNGPQWGPGVTIGGGMDYETPWHHLAIRLFQADYQYMHADFGPTVYGGRANINAARLSAGIVIHVGSIAPPPPVTLACTANPTAVFPGEQVTVTATAGNLDPKDNVIYSWTGNGVTGNGTTATVNTADLAPGSYSVQGTVKAGKRGKEGLKPWQTANCSAGFTVKEFEPPTISCSASPDSIQTGGTATITSQAMSPQNRTLTYSYTATAGMVSGTGSTAQFSAGDAPAGPVNITCNVSDDKGHTANANTTVTLVAPPPPPGPSPEQQRLEARLALHSVFFPTAMPRETHPEGGLLDSQQQTLMTLATDFKNYLTMKPDARLTLTGHADIRGTAKYNQALSERRVDRVKSFLVDQGVPADHIDTNAVGEEQQLTSDQVRDLVEQNPDLTPEQKASTLKRLSVIVLAQNRRVDITLSTTGQQSVKLYPFNASDAMTLLQEQAPVPKKKAGTRKK